LRGARAGPAGDARTAEPALAVWFWWFLFAPGWVVYALGAFLRFLSRVSLDAGTASSVPQETSWDSSGPPTQCC
jgi:hypothetical protein